MKVAGRSLYVEVQSAEAGQGMLVNYDAEGQLVETLGVAYREGGVPSTVIPANLSAGMYWMQLYNLQGMPMGDA